MPPYTRGSVALTGSRAKAWCLLSHKIVSLSRGGQGHSLVPPDTRSRVSLSHGEQGDSLVPHYIRGGVSLSLYHGGQGERLVPPYTRGGITVLFSLLAVLPTTSYPNEHYSPGHRMPLMPRNAGQRALQDATDFKKHGSKCVA